MRYALRWLCALLVWSWAALAAAAPSINGVSLSGDVVTIVGSGFGPGPSVLVFDRFNDEAPGSTMDNEASEYGSWTTQLRSPRAVTKLPRFSGDVAWDAHGTDIDEPRRFERALPNVREVFVSFDTTLAGGSYPGSGTFTSSSCWKFSWLIGASSTDGDVCVPTHKDSTSYYFLEGNEGLKTGTRQFPKASTFEMGNVWNSWSFWLKSASGVGNGDVNVESVNVVDGAYSQYMNPVIFDGDGIQYWTEWNLPGWVSGGTSVTIYHDNVYIAAGPYAQAHIELRDASAWGSATQRVMALPLTWSDTQITARVYRDNLPSAATLFVVHADGSRAGAAIDFATGGDPVVSITATDPTATEAVPTTGTITISCPDCSGQSVSWTAGGTATAGMDYSLSRTSPVALSGAPVAITVTPVDDADYDPAETVVITLQAGSGYLVGSPSYATVTIADNDTPADVIPPEIYVTAPNAYGSTVTTAATLDLAGAAADETALASVTYLASPGGGSGSATGTAQWQIAGVPLALGALGSELATGGDFGTPGDWQAAGAWSIAGGVAACSGAGAADLLQQPLAGLTVGEVYAVSLVVQSHASGALELSGAGFVGDGYGVVFPIGAVGTYTVLARCRNVSAGLVIMSRNWVGSLESVSLRPVSSCNAVTVIAHDAAGNTRSVEHLALRLAAAGSSRIIGGGTGKIVGGGI